MLLELRSERNRRRAQCFRARERYASALRFQKAPAEPHSPPTPVKCSLRQHASRTQIGKKSKTCAMFSCERTLCIRASFSKSSRRASFSTHTGKMLFTATCFSNSDRKEIEDVRNVFVRENAMHPRFVFKKLPQSLILHPHR